MTYCVVNADNIIVNVIVADSDFAESIGALPYYDGASIGLEYFPPAPEPTPEPEPELTVWDELDAAYQEGVDSV